MKRDKEALCHYWKKKGLIKDTTLFNAFMAVPREHFVDASLAKNAYQDRPLPIGEGQTISQPTTVMIMLQLLSLNHQVYVLEIGTGSGYNAALMAYIAKHVYTIERLSPLASSAKQHLRQADFSNVDVIVSDGKQGYLPGAPYQRIIITAATPDVPVSLLNQLDIGGIIVAPIGPPSKCKMTRMIKKSHEHYQTTTHGDFSFVPLL